MKKKILFLVLFSQSFAFAMEKSINSTREEIVEISEPKQGDVNERTPLLLVEKEPSDKKEVPCFLKLLSDEKTSIKEVFEYLSFSDLKNLMLVNGVLSKFVGLYFLSSKEGSKRTLTVVCNGDNFLHTFEHFGNMKTFILDGLNKFVKKSERRVYVFVIFKKKKKTEKVGLFLSAKNSPCKNKNAMTKFFFEVFLKSFGDLDNFADEDSIKGRSEMHSPVQNLITSLEEYEHTSCKRGFHNRPRDRGFFAWYNKKETLYCIQIPAYSKVLQRWSTFKELSDYLKKIKDFLLTNREASLYLGIGGVRDAKQAIKIVRPTYKNDSFREMMIENLPSIFAIILPGSIINSLERNSSFFFIEPIGEKERQLKKRDIIRCILCNEISVCLIGCCLLAILPLTFYTGVCVDRDVIRIAGLFNSNFTNNDDKFFGSVDHVDCDIFFPWVYWLIYLLRSSFN